MSHDKAPHIVLFFIGMVVYATLRKLADFLGLDIARWIKKKIGRIS